MTRQDTILILSILRTAYPRFYANTAGQDVQDAIDLWASLFVDESAEAVTLGVKAFIASDEKGFPPVPGQIRAILRMLAAEEYDSELKAWGMVRKALKNSQFDAKREFDKLPPLIRQTIGAASMLQQWGRLDPETVDVTIANSFMRSYREELRRTRETAALPPEARAILEKNRTAKRIEKT